MIYIFFLLLAIFYNLRKLISQKEMILKQLQDASEEKCRNIILGNYFYIFIFELFLSLVVALMIDDNFPGPGFVMFVFFYLCVVTICFLIFRTYLLDIKKKHQIDVWDSFQKHISGDLIANFAMILLPYLMYSLVYDAFSVNHFENWKELWPLGLIINIVFVYIVAIFSTVGVMLKIIPNKELGSDSYDLMIQKRLDQFKLNYVRVRWMEVDFKNAFVFGLNFNKFSNVAIFFGKPLKNLLTEEEFDSVLCHELAHILLKHSQKRLLSVMKVFFVINLSLFLVFLFIIMFPLMSKSFSNFAYIKTYGVSLVFFLTLFSGVLLLFAMLYKSYRHHEIEADLYAINRMGISKEHLINALNKLSLPMSPLRKEKLFSQDSSWWRTLLKDLRGHFSSHPSLKYRIQEILNDSIFEEKSHIPFYKKVKKTMGFMFFVPFLICGLVFWNISKDFIYLKKIKTTQINEVVEDNQLMVQLDSHQKFLGYHLAYYFFDQNQNSNDRDVMEKNKKIVDELVSIKISPEVILSSLKEYDNHLLIKYFKHKYQSVITNKTFQEEKGRYPASR